MTSERESERHERRIPHVWTPRVLVTAGVVVAGWFAPVGEVTAAAGTNAGPDLPHHAFPVPAPPHRVPDGPVSAASGHGPVDRAQNVSGDTSPLVLAPWLLASIPAPSRPTGTRERAVRPAVSPD